MEKDVLNEVENNEIDYDKALNEGLDKVKAEYEAKLAKEKALNIKLMKTITTNQKIDAEIQKPEMTHEQKVARHEDLAKSILNSKGKKNIDVVKDMIEFRKLTQELYDVDPATVKVMSNSPAKDTQDLHDRMDKVFNTLEQCVEQSNGNDKTFIRCIDDAIDKATYPKNY